MRGKQKTTLVKEAYKLKKKNNKFVSMLGLPWKKGNGITVVIAWIVLSHCFQLNSNK